MKFRGWDERQIKNGALAKEGKEIADLSAKISALEDEAAVELKKLPRAQALAIMREYCRRF
jgi:flagellar motility protein MotE (MotC chaperone)